MKLQDVFDALAYGETSQISVGGQAQGVYNETNWPVVINHANLGLMALYKRFNLKQGTLKITLIKDKLRYKLHSDYSLHSAKRPLEDKYIDDELQARFEDDLLKVLAVRVDSRCALPLNLPSQRYSVSTPSSTVLEVPEDIVNASLDLPSHLQTEQLTVEYRAKHPKIVIPLGYFDPAREEIELPDTHLEPLLYFIASRVHNPAGMENEFHAGNTWYMKYEQACQDLENQGMQIDQGDGQDRFSRGGWV